VSCVSTREAVSLYQEHGRDPGVLTKDERIFMLKMQTKVYGPCGHRKVAADDVVEMLRIGTKILASQSTAL